MSEELLKQALRNANAEIDKLRAERMDLYNAYCDAINDNSRFKAALADVVDAFACGIKDPETIEALGVQDRAVVVAKKVLGRT